MTKTNSPIRMLMGSDFHFGLRSIDQWEMAEAFAATIFPRLKDLDIFFINGDFFDTHVIFDSHAFDPVYDVVLSLFTLCQKHGVILRIMQGTHSHDRSQLGRFEGFYKKGAYTFDFRVIKTIDVEEIQMRDRALRFLYVPDDLPVRSTDEAMVLIRNRMQVQGWDYVDYGCLHGFFDFTFPKMLDQSRRVVYKEADFDFVRKAIDVGHVHQHRRVGKVISNGSFDRLCFGDEDPKGCVEILDHPDHFTAQFIYNENAAIFDTLYFPKAWSTQEWQQHVDTHLSDRHSKRTRYVRVKYENAEHLDAIRTYFRAAYPDIVLKTEKSTGGPEDAAAMVPSSDLITSLEPQSAPTPLTIASFIRAYIPEDYVLSEEAIDHYLEPSTL